MSIWKKILILLIVLITISILIILYRQRVNINKIYENMETEEEEEKVYTGEDDDISSGQHSEFKSIESLSKDNFMFN